MLNRIKILRKISFAYRFAFILSILQVLLTEVIRFDENDRVATVWRIVQCHQINHHQCHLDLPCQLNRIVYICSVAPVLVKLQ